MIGWLMRLRDRIAGLRRDPGLALVVLGAILATALYAPALGTGLVNYDDPWLYKQNFVLQQPSWDSLVAIFTDLDPRSPLRHTLAPEYLPIRDLSVMLDFAIWGDWYPGFHLTSLVLYLIAIAMLFRMLVAFGFDRAICGLAVFVWALHPVHAESVAWLSERKGLLGVVFAATTGLAFARFRAGGRARWLAVALLSTVAAVWSKAPAAFTIAALAGLELVAARTRVSWKRSLAGLAAIAVLGALAYLPVVSLAMQARVVGDSIVPGNAAEVVAGVHGHYVRVAAMLMPNTISYPIGSVGPSVLEVVLGAAGFVALAAAVVPRLGAAPEVRAGVVIWVFAWLPVGHLVLPLHQIAVADRYALVMVLGAALAVATGLRRLQPRLQVALVTVLAIAMSIRTLDARATWSDDLLLWERAVASNPHDPANWSSYALQLQATGQHAAAERAVEVGLGYGESPRLLLRLGLLQMARGERALAIETLRRAATGGDAIAMGNLAKLLVEDGPRDEALQWGRRAAAISPMTPHARRTHGMAALASGLAEEALGAFEAALALEPSAINRYNVALALLALGQTERAVPLLEQSLDDPRIGPLARAKLTEIRGGR
jgi:tetratricopeptide (TPR) repeat protein